MSNRFRPGPALAGALRLGLIALVWEGIILPIGAVSAQAPQPVMTESAPPPKIYTRRTVLHLPITLDARLRAEVREVYLYVKTVGGEWVRTQTAPADQTLFTFNAPQDGEYWFHVVTLSKTGELTPPDLNREPPGLVIIVDTQPPQVEIRPMPAPPGEALFQCEIRDANPDPTSLRLYQETAEAAWRPLEVVPDRPGLFRATGVQGQVRRLRVEAADRAGNVLGREIALDDTTMAQAPASPPASSPTVAPLTQVRATEPQVLTPPDPLSVPHAPEKSVAQPEPTASSRPVDKAALQTDPAPTPRSAEKTVTRTAENSSGVPGAMMFVNKTHLFLDYQIEGAGPGGVGKVEVWITKDMGQTWQKLCEDPRRHPPVEVTLPGEGLYGLTFVVTTASGFGGAPPARGDRPSGWVEVDLTKPEAKLVGTQFVAGSETGAVLITWTATDKNLGSAPIDLYYSAKQDGPWLPIARGVKNDGTFCWQVPPDVGPRINVRIDVTDQAGNATRCETTTPVLLDRTQVKVRLVGVTPGTTPPVP
jgi:hypothetical protein